MELCPRASSGSLPSQGHFFIPSLLKAPAGLASIGAEELVGPMAVVGAFDDADQVVDALNRQASGLAASVWGSDSGETRRIADRLRFGSVAVNAPLLRDARTPFGGLRRSGLGRVGGDEWVGFWSETKSTTLLQ